MAARVHGGRRGERGALLLLAVREPREHVQAWGSERRERPAAGPSHPDERYGRGEICVRGPLESSAL